MFRKLSIGFAALSLSALSAFAQFYPYNARIQSLGGTFIIDDINDVLRYPSLMNDYKNNIQATFVSPIIGIKSIGTNMSLGLVANRGLMLSKDFANDFYSTSSTNLGGAVTLGNQYIPHVIFGVNAGKLSLGFDGFVEYARVSAASDSSGKDLINTSASIHNFGVIASAGFGSEVAALKAKVGIGRPSIYGHRENLVANTETTVSSDRGFFLDAGVEAGLPVAGLDMTLGADAIFEWYAFQSNDTVEIDPKYSNNRLSIYAGVQDSVFERGIWGAQYNLNIRRHSEKWNNDSTAFKTNLTHLFTGGLENSWADVWVFSTFVARCGFSWSIETPHSTTVSSNDIKTATKSQANISEFHPTIGLGVTRKSFSLDVNLNLAPGGWDKLITGPGVATVTAGIKF